jgi:hypothetical protein
MLALAAHSAVPSIVHQKRDQSARAGTAHANPTAAVASTSALSLTLVSCAYTSMMPSRTWRDPSGTAASTTGFWAASIKAVLSGGVL